LSNVRFKHQAMAHSSEKEDNKSIMILKSKSIVAIDLVLQAAHDVNAIAPLTLIL